MKSSAQIWLSPAGAAQGLADAGRQTPLRSARQIQLHSAVHPMQTLVVDELTVQPQPVVELPEAPAQLASNDLAQHLDHPAIPLHARSWSSIPRRPRQPRHLAGPADR